MDAKEILDEIEKCKNEPWYFYNTYFRVKGELPSRQLTKEDWDWMQLVARFPKILKFRGNVSRKCVQQIIYDTIFKEIKEK